MDEVDITSAMSLAIAEAKNGLGQVHPNPPVGCVILDQSGSLLAKGYHQFFGGPHAEVVALQNLQHQDRLQGATVVVTLEPCAHEGKTPSCAKHLARLPIQKVIYGMEDPNPLVSGQGAQILREAGIEVEESQELREELTTLMEVFLWNQKTNSPFVGLKAATTANGSVVSGTDERWITGAEALEHVHFLRAQYDAVLVGVETFLQDNPRLNIRRRGHEKENFAVVLDPTGRGLASLEGSELLRARSADKVIWVVEPGSVGHSAAGVTVLQCPVSMGEFELKKLLDDLYLKNIRSVFVEGGAKTYQSFFRQRCVQRVYHFISPKLCVENKIVHWSQGLDEPCPKYDSQSFVFGADRLMTYRSFS